MDIGTEILAIVPGRVSSEVDARLSFDTEKTIEKANRLISLYEENNIGRFMFNNHFALNPFHSVYFTYKSGPS